MENSIYESITNIIIPARNYDRILDNTIKKIRLLHKNIKIILVLDIIDVSRNSLPNNVFVLQSKSFRMSAKRNQGAMFIDCEYIAFLDSDAYPCENWLNTGIKFLNENKDYSAVLGPWFNAENDTFEQYCTRIQRFMPLFSRKEWWKIIDRDEPDQDAKEFVSANVIIRRSDFIKAGMMNENIYIDEDIEFSGRFTSQGYKIRFLSDMAVFHRESKIYPYLKKVFCCGYYYSNMLIDGYCQRELKYFEEYFRKTALWHIAPLVLSTIYCIAFCLFVIFELPLLPLFILALLAFLIIIYSTYKACLMLDKGKIKGFFVILYISIMFCIVYVISTIYGLFNIPTKGLYKMFKQ